MKTLLLLVLISSGCHVCHEELRPFYMCFGALPFIGIYFKSWWAKLHNKECVHDSIAEDTDVKSDIQAMDELPEANREDVSELEKQVPKFDPFLSAHPFAFNKAPPFVTYDIKLRASCRCST